MAKLLVIDDEESICWGLEKLGKSLGHNVVICSTAEDGLAAAKTECPNAIVLDVRLPGMDGLTAMSQFQSVCDETPIVVMTAYGELDSAVAAIKNGAFEYLPKPFDLDRVKNVIERAIESNLRATRPNSNTSHGDSLSDKLGDIVGSCSKMQELFRRIAFAATSNASVLITGESGTGKEIAARAIHRYSRRSEQPFVAVNIAALSPTLAESELFGHVRGSFTGADGDRKGLLEQANGGTLFLDELAEVPMSIQVKLLRCLDQGEVLPIGASVPVKTDFRVVSATHQNLSTAVASGSFRHDLFFRICAFQIELPPLRDREDDVIQLAEFFIRELETSTPNSELSESAKLEIKSRTWHGNVRELRNSIEHALILARGSEIRPEHLPAPVQHIRSEEDSLPELPARINQLLRTWTEQQLRRLRENHASSSEKNHDLYNEFLQLLEPEFLATVMRHFDNQYVAAAKALGIHRTTLKKKMTDHGIDKV